MCIRRGRHRRMDQLDVSFRILATELRYRLLICYVGSVAGHS